jgi:hypothetical protein
MLPLVTSIPLTLNIPSTSVLAEEKPYFDTSDVYDDLKSASNFDFNKYKLNSSVSDEISIKGITLLEDFGNGLYFYIYNKNGKSLDTNLSGARISMSTKADDYTDTSYYYLNLLDKTENNLFYKFKVNYEFKEYSSNRSYHVSEIEFNYGQGYGLGRHATIGHSYFYSGIGDSLKLETKQLEIVKLDIEPGNYRFNTLNENSTTSEQHYWDMFYITFPIDKTYGDLIGLKMSWYEKNYNFYLLNEDYNNESLMNNPDALHTISDTYVLDYSNKDLLKLDSLSSINNIGKSLLVNLNPLNWFIDQDTNYNIPVIDKVKFDNGGSSDFNGYYFNNSTISSLRDSYKHGLGSNEYYVIRFKVSDFCNSVDLKPLSRHIVYTKIMDCDVLTLTFVRDGESYTIMNSAKPEEPIDPGIENPKTDLGNWWEDIEKLIRLVCGIVLFAVVFIFLYPFISPIIGLIIKLLIKIIILPFKAISKLFKKKQ